MRIPGVIAALAAGAVVVMGIVTVFAQPADPERVADPPGLVTRTATTEVVDLGGGVYQSSTSLRPNSYFDERTGRHEYIDTRWLASDLPQFDWMIDRAEYKVYFDATPTVGQPFRRFQPDRTDPTTYADILATRFLQAVTLTLNADGRTLEWSNARYDLSFTAEPEGIKMLLVKTRKNPPIPNSVDFDVVLSSITEDDFLASLNVRDVWDADYHADPGTGVIRQATVTLDSGVLTFAWDDTDMTYPVYIDPSQDISVAADADDGYYKVATDDFDINDSSFIIQPNNTIQGAGLRFVGLSLTGTAATRDFTTVQVEMEACADRTPTGTAIITMADVNNSAAPTSGTGSDYDTITRTSASVTWTPPQLFDGTNYKTDNFEAVMDEVDDNWDVDGDAVVVFIGENGTDNSQMRFCDSRFGGRFDPQLELTWTVGGAAATPTPGIIWLTQAF